MARPDCRCVYHGLQFDHAAVGPRSPAHLSKVVCSLHQQAVLLKNQNRRFKIQCQPTMYRFVISESHQADVFRQGCGARYRWYLHVVDGRGWRVSDSLRSGSLEEQSLEFADVIAWLTTIANVAGVDLAAAVAKEVRHWLSRLRSFGMHL